MNENVIRRYFSCYYRNLIVRYLRLRNSTNAKADNASQD